MTIETYQEPEHVVLLIADEGNGINAEHLEKLGRPFFTTKDEGTGLGLAICYSIAARHHASIEVQLQPEWDNLLDSLSDSCQIDEKGTLQSRLITFGSGPSIFISNLHVQIFTFPCDHINDAFTDIRGMIRHTLQEVRNKQQMGQLTVPMVIRTHHPH